jgi:hypothetical protein
MIKLFFQNKLRKKSRTFGEIKSADLMIQNLSSTTTLPIFVNTRIIYAQVKTLIKSIFTYNRCPNL